MAEQNQDDASLKEVSEIDASGDLKNGSSSPTKSLSETPTRNKSAEKYWSEIDPNEELVWMDYCIEDIPRYELRKEITDEQLLICFHNFHATLNTRVKDASFATLMNLMLQLAPNLLHHCTSCRFQGTKVIESVRRGPVRELIIPENLSTRMEVDFNSKKEISVPKSKCDIAGTVVVDDKQFNEWYSDISNKQDSIAFFALFSMASFRILTKSKYNSMKHLQGLLFNRFRFFARTARPPAFPLISEKFIESYQAIAREDYASFKSILADVIYHFHFPRLYRDGVCRLCQDLRGYVIQVPLSGTDMAVLKLLDKGNAISGGKVFWLRDKIEEMKNATIRKQFENCLRLLLTFYIKPVDLEGHSACLITYARLIDKRFYSSLSNAANKELWCLLAGIEASSDDSTLESIHLLKAFLPRNKERISYFRKIFKKGFSLGEDLREGIDTKYKDIKLKEDLIAEFMRNGFDRKLWPLPMINKEILVPQPNEG